MSSPFRRRPSPFAMQQNAMKNRQKPDATKHIEKDKPDDGFRLYPLTPGQNPKVNRQNRGARTVQPLPQSAHARPSPQAQGNNHRQMPQSGPRQMQPQMQNGFNPTQQQSPQGFHPMQAQSPQGFHHGQPPQPPVATPPAAPIPPQKAADQFRRVNNGLPDGVRYEPLDEETMRLLRDNGHLPKQPATSQPPANQQPIQQSADSQPPTQPLSPPTSTRTPMIPPDSPNLATVNRATQPQSSQTANANATTSERSNAQLFALSGAIPMVLEGLAQDERNAQVFYSSLSENIESTATRELLLSLSTDCAARLKQYTTLLTNHCNRIFTPLETEINTNLSFPEALTLALAEENKALLTLSNLLDQVSDTPAENAIQRIINKKIVGHQLLLSLN